jgi:hypothetical protein
MFLRIKIDGISEKKKRLCEHFLFTCKMNRKPFDAPFAEPSPSPSRKEGPVCRQRYPVKDCPHPRAFVEKPVQNEGPSKTVFILRIDLAYIALAWIIVFIVLFACALKSVK